jgi:hypothetical protein
LPSEAVVLAALTLGTMPAPLNSTMIVVALPKILGRGGAVAAREHHTLPPLLGRGEQE